jgi:hypothetical protein
MFASSGSAGGTPLSLNWLLRVLAAVCASAFGFLVCASASASEAFGYAYDTAVHVYDGATHSVVAHVESAAPVAPDTIPLGPRRTAVLVAGSLSVSSLKSVAANTAPRAIVIGEDMEGRVIPYAREIGADWYEPPAAPPSEWLPNNRNWINGAMDEGRPIIDRGPAPGRANFPNPTSPYYKAELGEISARDYSDYFRVQPEGTG